MDTQFLIGIHIRNNLFQDLVDIGKLCTELFVDFINQLRQGSLFFLWLWLSGMKFIGQRLTLLQRNRPFKNFLNPVILQRYFIIQKYRTAAISLWKFLLKKFCVSMELMQVGII